ncbi:MAG: 1-phosphofructokinase [Oscillospiraceae bacterium]|nr:1-phosphofructokinase [Oscillospiraceae bacterium]MBQ8883245.1 1-phosphofructokinase [Oscillospiraceae bacterium]
MIYTVTFNPAVDYVMHTGEMKTGFVNRSNREEIYFGGKGINVSLVLKELEIESVALGFVAGFTGDAIEKGVCEKGVKTDFVHLKNGFSRINVKIKSDKETELNGQGPFISDEEIAELFSKLDKLSEGDTLVLAGSIPNTLPDDIYEKILARLENKKVRCVVDCSGKLLLKVLKYRPFLVKPNDIELGEMFGVSLENISDVEKYARELKKMGALNVLVSMAEKGALLVDENDKTHISGVCKGEVKNSVGAGDSMVAGFVAGLSKGDYEYALKLGTASGGATTFSEGLGEKALIDKLLKELV